MQTPVVFLVFNRPALTRQVFERIRAARPPKLLVVCDGPRASRPTDEENVRAVRQIIADGVDWECDVQTNYAASNLGCRERVATGLNWAFEQVDAAIVLEDDCLPDPSFFPYCEQLLTRYREDHRVMHIGGTNLAAPYMKAGPSYWFSHQPAIWGWATWSRAWRHYDLKMTSWAGHLGTLRGSFANRWEEQFWMPLLERCHAAFDTLDTWDFSWMYTCRSLHGICVLPRKNLVTNIGLETDSTHTFVTSQALRLPSTPLGTLIHPATMEWDRYADILLTLRWSGSPVTLLQRMLAIARIWREPKRDAILRIPAEFRTENSGLRMLKTLAKAARSAVRYLQEDPEERRLRELPRYTQTFTMFQGRRLSVPDACSFIASREEIFGNGAYRFTTACSQPRIVDCGANIGMSVIHFKLEHPGATILAFEPDPHLFEALKANVTAFGFSDVTLEQKAVWVHNDTVTFQQEGGHSGRVLSKAAPEATSVSAVRLYDLLAERVDFLKVDVEGAEFTLLQDCTHRLTNVERLFVEYHSKRDEAQRLDELLRLIRDAGFRYDIKQEFGSPHPFVAIREQVGFDLQLSIACYRPGVS